MAFFLGVGQRWWAGRTTISLTSTPGGCVRAYDTASAMASGSIACARYRCWRP
ncbi:hypothetical protein [Actinoallomurus sp. NPDC050550]|uniref:hypothetical protein n=1 Tax=Actinoallomurus sp. NPDC050550 TaxID=3154937 RepID=UPI0033D8FA44